MNSKPNLIALTLLLTGAILTVFLFAASRQDPSLRIAALVAATAYVSSLGSIASTLLTGKDVTGKGASDLPPGSHVTQQSDIKVPPVPDPKV